MTTENWVQVPGYENLYEVSDLGSVRSMPRKAMANYGERIYGGKLLAPVIRKADGYLVVSMYRFGVRSQRTIHTLVIEAFVGPAPDGMECCHNNGRKSDCRLENLRWGTKQENSKDKALHGTALKGSKNPSAKLCERDVIEILQSSGTCAEIAAKYSVSDVLIGNIRRGKSWRHVPRATLAAKEAV